MYTTLIFFEEVFILILDVGFTLVGLENVDIYRYQFNTVLLCILLREKLMSVLRALVNNPIKVSFDINFMGTEKNCQNINCFFFSP